MSDQEEEEREAAEDKEGLLPSTGNEAIDQLPHGCDFWGSC